jgi:oligopeptide/dipeptide ABC transporter ATP-binding protein
MNGTKLPPVLRVAGLKKHFGVRGGKAALRAVDGVDITIGHGETVGVVGESGCGKSTLGKTILRIHEPSEGRIEFDTGDGKPVDIAHAHGRALAAARRHMNIVFQDPFSSLNPRKTVRFSIGEPLALSGMRGKAVADRVAELLELVGLPAQYMERFPHAFSGGQRQRIALARAIALNPRLIVADEAVSALDVSVQAQIVNLFLGLQRRLGIAFLFISHDVKIVRHVSDRIVVMYLGRIVEEGPPDEICTRPRHPYTAALLSAVPVADNAGRPGRIVLSGDPPSPINPPSGCRFRTRCPYATDRCAAEEPQLRRLGGSEVACHYAETLELRGLAAPSGSLPPLPLEPSQSA